MYISYNDLYLAYQKAIKLGQNDFEFRGYPILTLFAKYMLDYMKILMDKGGFSPDDKFYKLVPTERDTEWTPNLN